MSEDKKQVLNREQVRVLASLMEKHLATPNNYPLTPNSLTLACNQKSNRHPVMSMDEGKVVHTAQQLNELGFVSVDHGDRIVKFSHRAPGKLKITREEQAIMAILMLREPLTLSEIKTRTDKMVGFETLEKVQNSVNQLISRSSALLIELPVAVGQREERYTHLLAGEPDLSTIVVKPSAAPSRPDPQKIEELEYRIERLEAALDIAWEK